jgi:hypothetical protein
MKNQQRRVPSIVEVRRKDFALLKSGVETATSSCQAGKVIAGNWSRLDKDSREKTMPFCPAPCAVIDLCISGLGGGGSLASLLDEFGVSCDVGK